MGQSAIAVMVCSWCSVTSRERFDRLYENPVRRDVPRLE